MTALTSTVLVVGAVIGLEAAGLLFRGGPPEHTIASLQTEVDSVRRAEEVLLWPLEELDRAALRSQIEQARRTAKAQFAARPAVDEDRYLADALRWAEQYRQRQEAGRRLAALEHPPAAAGEGIAEAPDLAQPKLAQREPEPQAAPQPMSEEDRNLADALRWAEQYRRRNEAEQWAAVVEYSQPVVERALPEAAGQTEWLPQGSELKLVATRAEPPSESPGGPLVAEAKPPPASPLPAKCTAPCPAEAAARHDVSRAAPPAQPHRRAKVGRAGVRRGGSAGCPFLGWLQL